MPDGRLAFISNMGNKIIRPGAPENVRHVVISNGGNSSSEKDVTPPQAFHALPGDLGELCSLPDNRLLCTVPAGDKSELYDGIAVLDPDHGNRRILLYRDPGKNLHSLAYLGASPKPRVFPGVTGEKQADDPGKTGFFFCQNVRNTRNTAADWKQVCAVRVLSGKASTLRAAAFLAVHEGVEAVELGTVPLAPDGSFFVEVPADTPVAFQMIDAEGRAEMNQMSWIYVRPGETKSCVGCHNSRQATPQHSGARGLALRAKPVKTLGQGKPFRFRGQSPWMGGMMDLQLERLRETASLDQHALVDGADLTGQQELELLITWLKSPDAGLRISACQRLSVFHHRGAATNMANLINDSRREVRLAAILGLSACGTRDSVGPLLEVLSDPDPIIAQAAAVAIENLTGHAEDFNPFTAKEDRDRQAMRWKDWFKSQTWESLERDLIAQVQQTDPNKIDVAPESFLFKLVEGKTHDLERIVIHNYGQAESGYNFYARDFSVWVSTTTDDGKVFRKVLEATLKPTTDPQTFKIASVPAKYIRLQVDSGYEAEFIEMGEFEAYTAAGVNVVGSTQGGKLLKYSSEFPKHLDRGIWAATSIHDGVNSGTTGSWCSNPRRRGEHPPMPAHIRVGQRRAIVALGHIGGDAARQALLNYVASQKDLPYVQGRTLFGIYFQADSPYNPRTQQEAIRALGHLPTSETTSLLKEIVEQNIDHRESNLFLSETSLEALGYCCDESMQAYLVGLFGRLREYHQYYNWYGPGHPNNEASTLHYRVLKSLDKMGATTAADIVPAIIRSLPIDPDRQLFMDTDDYETVAGRVIRRSGSESKVVETCLAMLGEPSNGTDEKTKEAVSKLYIAFGGNPGLKNRAAQVLSIVCRDRKCEPRIRAAFNRYRSLPRDPASSDSLIAALENDPNEAAFGRPGPDTLYVGLLQDEHTPCYRAAAARALGNIREKRAAGTLLRVLSNLDNALDTRYAAAVALKRIADDGNLQAIAKLAIDYPDVSIKKVLLSISRN